MTRRLIATLVLALVLASCRWVPPPTVVHRPGPYCFGEGGHVDGCVSPGSRGTAP